MNEMSKTGILENNLTLRRDNDFLYRTINSTRFVTMLMFIFHEMYYQKLLIKKWIKKDEFRENMNQFYSFLLFSPNFYF